MGNNSSLESIGSRTIQKSKKTAKEFSCSNFGTYDEILENDNIDAVYSLARFRGHQIGVRYAECFEVCKVVASLDKSGFKISGTGKNK